MSRIAPPDGPAVLVSWVSVGARAAPLLAALDEESPLYRKVQKLYLLWRFSAHPKPPPCAHRNPTTVRRWGRGPHLDEAPLSP